MGELYIKTENGRIPIDPKQVEKYKLKLGGNTPNTQNLMVGKNGEEHPKPQENKTSKHTLDEMKKDKMVFQTAEIIDISQGADSDQDYKV